jgi:hypothetical protein
MEEVVFLAAGAFCALKAAYEQQRHAYGHEDGQKIGICRKPMNHLVHKALPTRVDVATKSKSPLKKTLGR